MTVTVAELDDLISRATKAILPRQAIEHLVSARVYIEAVLTPTTLRDAALLPPLTDKHRAVFAMLSPDEPLSHAEVLLRLHSYYSYHSAMDALNALVREGYARQLASGGLFRWVAIAAGEPRPLLLPRPAVRLPTAPPPAAEVLDLDDLSPLAHDILKRLSQNEPLPVMVARHRKKLALAQLRRLGLISSPMARVPLTITRKGEKLLTHGSVTA